MFKIITNKKILLFILTLVFLPMITFAVEKPELFWERQTSTETDLLVIRLNLKSLESQINAFGGEISFDNKKLEYLDVKDSGSVVSFWIEKPQLKENKIIFSGITPGGYIGESGEIFEIYFKIIEKGKTEIKIENAEFLLNDGNGTKAQDIVLNNFSGDFDNVSGDFDKNIYKFDLTKPEKFKILRSKDQNIFDNKWFITFVTQDKESGVSKYTVCELWGGCKKDILSPYQLKNQSSFYFVTVKAFDKNNNSQNSFLVSKNLIFLTIFLLFFIALIFIFLKYTKNQKS